MRTQVWATLAAMTMWAVGCGGSGDVQSTAQAHVIPPGLECWVTGGGFVGSQEITFGFNALKQPNPGGQHITIQDHPAQDGFFCDVNLAGCDCTATGGTAVFSGDLRVLHGTTEVGEVIGTCEVTVIDNGEGANADPDRIWFTNTGDDLIPTLTDLEGGNVQIHPTHCE
jgi:hypothetical protein